MGCGSSHDVLAAAASAVASTAARHRHGRRRRADDPATLCRERAALIHAAADRRFKLAAAHAAYFRALAAVGAALRGFTEAALMPATPQVGSSPVLTLPASPAKPAAASTWSLASSPSSTSTVSPLSHSLSDDDLEEARSNARQAGGRGGGHASSSASSSRHHHRHYMRSSSTVPTNAQHTEGETGYRYEYDYGHPYPYGPYGEAVAEERPPRSPPSPRTSEPPPWEFFDPFSTYDQFMEEYSRNRGQVDADLPTNSPSYSELRRMEGIPELEDEAELEEAAAAKPRTSGNADQSGKGKRPVPANAGSRGGSSDSKLQKEGSGSGANGQPVRLTPRNNSVPSNASSKSKDAGKSSMASVKGMDGGDIDGSSSTGKNKGVAFDAEGSTIDADRDGGSHGKSVKTALSSEAISPLHHGERDVLEAMEDVKKQFDEALNCSAEVSKLLEVGKVPHGDSATPRVLTYFSSRLVDPLQHRRSRPSSGMAGTSASSVTDRRNGAGSLSSTLVKLCVWEKKLFQEVKEEEKLRIMYEKKYKRLKSLDERGAEPDIIDSTRLSVRNLQSRIDVSVRTVRAFSSKVEKIRDEELYPQLVGLIQGLSRMWKAVLECHEKQLLAIEGSKIHLLKAVTISKSGDAAMTTIELEKELVNLHRCFNKWISTQRSYVEALNEWLKRWLPEVQEEEDTPDGVPPFSPGKLGAPPIFVISNDWLQAIEMLSKNEVLGSMDHFSKLVHHFKKIQENEHRQKRKAEQSSRIYFTRHELLKGEFGLRSGRDLDALIKNPYNTHERVTELRKMRKKMDEEVATHGELVESVHQTASGTLPLGLVPMLQEIIKFFQANVQVYTQIRIQGA